MLAHYQEMPLFPLAQQARPAVVGRAGPAERSLPLFVMVYFWNSVLGSFSPTLINNHLFPSLVGDYKRE